MDDTASTLASKSTHLFDVVRRPDGRELSNEEVATAVTDVINRFRRLERLPAGRPNDQ
ncbi:hypothetical protein [Nocardia anaemiae]|uniref:hypothetical protein n=1 Tax=Nocardia anaemiae TaxID=263910 RepID=UPI000AD7A6AB|nr:hypothetical protein [Nocardia anaemiae]